MGRAKATPRIRGRTWQATRKRIALRAFGLCERCSTDDKPVIGSICDHIVPLAHGGSNEDDNLRWICKACDKDVTAEQFETRVKPTIGVDGWPV